MDKSGGLCHPALLRTGAHLTASCLYRAGFGAAGPPGANTPRLLPACHLGESPGATSVTWKGTVTKATSCEMCGPSQASGADQRCTHTGGICARCPAWHTGTILECPRGLCPDSFGGRNWGLRTLVRTGNSAIIPLARVLHPPHTRAGGQGWAQLGQAILSARPGPQAGWRALPCQAGLWLLSSICRPGWAPRATSPRGSSPPPVRDCHCYHCLASAKAAAGPPGA